MPGTLHEQGVDILYNHLEAALGRELLATAKCNECPDEIAIDLMQNADRIMRGQSVGPVVPDLALLDGNGRPTTFVEVVVTHAPDRNVHRYAIENSIRVVEFHLNATADPSPARRERGKALSEALAIKASLRDLREGRLRVDAHNLLCERPRCEDCQTPRPLRTVVILEKDCWKCHKATRVAVGSRDSEHLYPAHFTDLELAFARDHGVILDVRYSATRQERYLANVCSACDQIQGDWFLYQDPFHDSYRIAIDEREGFEGPCESCSQRDCSLHGAFRDYEADGECPTCLDAARVRLCPNREGRDCYYPATCHEQGCYFTRRSESRRSEAQRQAEKAAKANQETLESIEEDTQPLKARIRGCTHCGASRRSLRPAPQGHITCTECGTDQEPDHYRM